MTTDEVVQRLEQLRRPWWTAEEIVSHYGLDISTGDLKARLDAFAPMTRRYRDGVVRPDGLINRFGVETFFQVDEVLPLRWAAAQLGMTETSFQAMTEGLLQHHRLSPTSAPRDGLVPESVVRRASLRFESTRDRVFADHDGLCAAVHRAARDELGVESVPVHCVTSTQRHDVPPDFAHDLDALTGDPIGLRYQVWLETNKPINLAPDACSQKIYEQHSAILARHVLHGHLPESPDGRADHQGRAHHG